MISLHSLVGYRVWTVDHVKRTVKTVDGYLWTDEDGITLTDKEIDAVVVGGQSVDLRHALRLANPWVEA